MTMDCGANSSTGVSPVGPWYSAASAGIPAARFERKRSSLRSTKVSHTGRLVAALGRFGLRPTAAAYRGLRAGRGSTELAEVPCYGDRVTGEVRTHNHRDHNPALCPVELRPQRRRLESN